MFANVIFPLFDLPYMAGIFSPWLAAGALAAEIIVFYGFHFRTIPLWPIFAVVLGANIISTLVGFFALAFLPSPDNGPHWLIYLTFIMAWLLSVGIEFGVYFTVPRWRRFQHLLVATATSNGVSYCILLLAYWRETV